MKDYVQRIRRDAVAFRQESVRGAEHHLIARGRMRGRSELQHRAIFLASVRLCVDQDSDWRANRANKVLLQMTGHPTNRPS